MTRSPQNVPDESLSAGVNWDPPSKHDLVQRALSDGMTDPSEIIAWAKTHHVHLTRDEIETISAALKKEPPVPEPEH